MIHRLDTRQPHPLFDSAANRRIELLAHARLAPHTLMQAAGAAVARLAQSLAPHSRTVWIACGPGNNGGDGFEAAAQLHLAGRHVSVTHTGDPARMPPDALWAYRRARDAGVPFVDHPPAHLGSLDLCIDALLGIGAVPRMPSDAMQRCLQALHDVPCSVLAVDVPSGLDATTGQYLDGFDPSPSRGPRHTLALLTLKPGLFTGHGRDAAGEVWWDDLGIHYADFDGTSPTAWLSGLPVEAERTHASHKGSYGDVTVLGGEGLGRRGMGMAGAALLAGSAALHAGAGRVLVALLDTDDQIAVDTAQPELMLRSSKALDLGRGTVVCGCGGGEAIRDELPRVLKEARRLVLDADALNAVAADDSLQRALRARAADGLSTILTPHPLEAARLLATDTAAVQADRLATAVRLAERYHCVAVLKGSGTVVAAPGKTIAVNPTGNGRLATAGTGDVLAGMTGARLAAIEADGEIPIGAVFAAARDAVYHHGALADAWPPHLPLTAGGLARQAADR